MLLPVLTALVLKAVYLLQSRESPFFNPLLLDSRYYHEWALRLLQGDPGGVFYGLPLYPFFLALVYKLTGLSVHAVKWVQVLLGVASVALAYRIGLKLYGKKAAFWGALLGALYGPLTFHEPIFIPEALGVPIYAAAFLCALYFFERPAVWRGLLLGFLFGLAALTKAGILLFALFFGAYFLKKDPSRAKAAALGGCVLAFVLTIAPVTAHNVIRGKDLVWLTSHAGFNFYVGNHPGAEGVFSPPEGTGTNVEAQIKDSRALAERAAGRPLKPSEVSRYWSGRAWAFIREHPGEFLRLSLAKLALFFDAREISDVDDYRFERNFNPFLRIPWPDFTLLGPLVFLGLWFSRRQKDAGVLYLWVGCYLAGMVAFFVNARYRLPMLPVFFPVAAFGVQTTVEHWKASRWKDLVLAGAVLALGVWVGHLQLVGTNFVRDYVNAGDAYVEMKQPQTALSFYKRALQIDPHHGKGNLAMALCLTRLGREDEAKGFYEKALKANPRNSQVWNNLGMWYDQKGDLESAERYFLTALELDPGSSQAHNNLGMVYGKSGRFAEAAAEFEKSLALNPQSARANTNLGLMALRSGDRERAKRLWQKALQIDPDFQEAKKAMALLDSFDSP